MAEFLLRIADKQGFDPKENALSSRPGDVIVVCPDGWPWSAAELKNPDWRIIKMPGVPVENLADMLISAVVIGKDGGETLLHKRAKKFDISHPVFDAAKVAVEEAVTLTTAKDKSDVLAAKLTKDAAQITVGK